MPAKKALRECFLIHHKGHKGHKEHKGLIPDGKNP